MRRMLGHQVSVCGPSAEHQCTAACVACAMQRCLVLLRLSRVSSARQLLTSRASSFACLVRGCARCPRQCTNGLSTAAWSTMSSATRQSCASYASPDYRSHRRRRRIDAHTLCVVCPVLASCQRDLADRLASRIQPRGACFRSAGASWQLQIDEVRLTTVWPHAVCVWHAGSQLEA